MPEFPRESSPDLQELVLVLYTTSIGVCLGFSIVAVVVVVVGTTLSSEENHATKTAKTKASTHLDKDICLFTEYIHISDAFPTTFAEYLRISRVNLQNLCQFTNFALK